LLRCGEQERRELLENIMVKLSGTAAHFAAAAADLPSIRDVNRLISRSDDELKDFERMDREYNAEMEARGFRGRPRLLSKEEVPPWVFLPEPGAGAEGGGGRGEGGRRRKRQPVVYSDNLTELQWLQMVEEGQDPAGEEAQEKQRERQERRQEKRRKKGRRGKGRGGEGEGEGGGEGRVRVRGGRRRGGRSRGG